MKKVINLTPHAINFVDAEGRPLITVNPSGQVARVTSKTVTTGVFEVWTEVFAALDAAIDALDAPDTVQIPTTATEYGVVEGLPDPEADTIYIVSSLVASRVPDRSDVFIPNESVRDDKGRIIGCKSLGHI